MQKLVLVAFLAFSACGPASKEPTPPAVPADARTVFLSLHGLDCVECIDEVRAEIEKEGKLYAFEFDKKKVVARVVVAREVNDQKLVAAAARAKITAKVGAEGGSWLSDEPAPSGADVATVVDDGRDVPDLAKITVPGKVTVVDFYADWCGPCRKVDAFVKKKLDGRSDLAYRRLNVVDWDTPLAKRYMKGVPELPYVIVFDKKGAQVDAIAGVDLPRLDAAIGKGAQ